MMTDCGESLAQENLALVLEVVVQDREDILTITECERVAAPVERVSSGRSERERGGCTWPS
jgi:hypothetical protein